MQDYLNAINFMGRIRSGWLVSWLVFYGISFFVGYLIPNSVYLYIYIYKIIALMVRKKILASDLKMKIYNESLSRGKNIYWGKKRKGQPYHTNWKKSRHAIGWSKEKNIVRAVKLKCKKCSILSRAK